jgi:hypothetical protein
LDRQAVGIPRSFQHFLEPIRLPAAAEQDDYFLRAVDERCRLRNPPALAGGRLLDELGDRFFKDDGLRASITVALETVVAPFYLSTEHREQTIEVVRRFLRTPSFLVRYFPLEGTDLAAGMAYALQAQESGESLRERIESFCRFLSELSTDEERTEFLTALLKVQTGTHFGKEVRSAFDPAEGDVADEGALTLVGTSVGPPSFESQLIVGELFTASRAPEATPPPAPAEPVAEPTLEPLPETEPPAVEREAAPADPAPPPPEQRAEPIEPALDASCASPV